MIRRTKSSFTALLATAGVMLTGAVIAANTYDAGFMNAIAQRESSGRATVVNQYGYAGLYQMGGAALIDAGYKNRDGSWTGRNGVTSMNSYLNNTAAQNDAVQRYWDRQWQTAQNLGLTQYVGQTVGGVQVTESGLIAAMHLGGPGNVQNFLKSGGSTVFKDANGTAITSYMQAFGGYDTPYGNSGTGGPGGGLGTVAGGGTVGGGGYAALPDCPDESGSGGGSSAGSSTGGASGGGSSNPTWLAAVNKGIELQGAQFDAQVQQPPELKTLSCLDDLLNKGFKFDATFNVPTLDSLLKGIENEICNQAKQAFNKATQGMKFDLGSGLGIPGIQFGMNGGVGNTGGNPVDVNINSNVGQATGVDLSGYGINGNSSSGGGSSLGRQGVRGAVDYFQ